MTMRDLRQGVLFGGFLVVVWLALDAASAALFGWPEASNWIEVFIAVATGWIARATSKGANE